MGLLWVYYGFISWGLKGLSSQERALTATGVSKERPKI